MAQRKELDINLSDIPKGSNWGTVKEPEESGITPPNTLFVEYAGINIEPGGVLSSQTNNTGNTHLYVNGKSDFSGSITGTTANFSGLVSAGSFSANSKSFNISHPSPDKQGTRLVHGCLEGPEHAVYVRGRVKNITEIILPDYWKDLVDENTMTVNLTPIGVHQDVIVKEWSLKSIQLQSKDEIPIDCFYTVHGERKDIPSLVIEQDEAVD